MHISLTPQRRDELLTLSKSGDSLIINGESFNFSTLSEGETLAATDVDCSWLAGDITRLDGELHLSLILPHGSDAPEETLFPAPLTVLQGGPVTLPPHSRAGA